jgi:hypothetical protein
VWREGKRDTESERLRGKEIETEREGEREGERERERPARCRSRARSRATPSAPSATPPPGPCRCPPPDHHPPTHPLNLSSKPPYNAQRPHPTPRRRLARAFPHPPPHPTPPLPEDTRTPCHPTYALFDATPPRPRARAQTTLRYVVWAMVCGLTTHHPDHAPGPRPHATPPSGPCLRVPPHRASSRHPLHPLHPFQGPG